MKVWRSSRAWLFPLLVCLCAAAVLWTAHEGKHGLSLDPKIKPYEISNLTVTILIAFFLQYYLAGRARDSRAEKDILISNVKEVIEQLRLCRERIVAHHDGKPIPKAAQQEIISSLRRVSNGLFSVEGVMEISDCADVSEKSRLLQNELLAYKMAATGGKFPGGYTPAVISTQEQAYRKLHREIHVLVFQINKHA